MTKNTAKRSYKEQSGAREGGWKKQERINDRGAWRGGGVAGNLQLRPLSSHRSTYLVGGRLLPPAVYEFSRKLDLLPRGSLERGKLDLGQV